MSLGSVMGGPPPPDDPLTAEERACLLRAARIQLSNLQGELLRLEQLPSVYAAGPVAAVTQEVACLAKAVGWLWRQHAKP